MDHMRFGRLGAARDALSPVIRRVGRLARGRRAVAALEYGLIAALVAVFLIGAAKGLGSAIKTTFSTVASTIAGA